MNKLKALSSIVLATLIIAAVAAPPCAAARRDSSLTRITHEWIRIERHRTCLFFDAEGPRPTRIGPASETGVSIFFVKMAVGLRDKIFKERRSAVKEIQFRRGSSFFEVLFRWKNTSVTYYVRNRRHGRYTLTLILTPPAVKDRVPVLSDENKTIDFIRDAKQKAPLVKMEKIKSSQLFGSTLSTQAKDVYARELKTAKAVVAPKAHKTRPGSTAFVEPDKNGLALYAHANELFEHCSRHLVFCASNVVEAYRAALNAGPESSQAPLAIYRSGLAYYIMGQYARAQRFFKTVTSQWPDNPVASRCWIGLGDISLKQEAYVAAMVAYQSAARTAASKEDEAAADYALGKTYLLLGVDKEALDMLQDCLAKAPDYYTKNPRVLRYIGAAEFGLGDLDEAKQMLLRYVNSQESDPSQDIVLAKIAEIFRKQGQEAAAKKMYGFVHKYYTNSDGDIICRIRAAELKEKLDPKKAIKRYDEILSRDLSPSLRSIVLVKLADLEIREGNLRSGLSLMDEAFPLKADGVPPAITTLRERVLCALVNQYYSTKSFDKIVQLVDKYQVVFDSITFPETREEIAESYAGLKLYSQALGTYDTLLAQQHGAKLGGILLRCADYALRMRDYGRALRYCQAVRSDALESQKSEILGQIYYRGEHYGKAVDCFEKALQKSNRFDIRDPDSYAAFGCSLYELKKYGQAVPILRKALLSKTLDNDSRRSILLTLSDCLKEQKQYAQAAQLMETAIRISSRQGHSELLYKLSKLYLAAGEPAMAVQSLNRIKTTNDSFWSAVAQQELNTIKIAQGTGGQQQ